VDDEHEEIDMRYGIGLLALVLVLGACGDDDGEQRDTGLPNPAAVFCEEQGGTVEIRTGEDGGQYGVCVFDDGSECDEWAYYRGECSPGGAGPGIANPASVFCEEQGGTVEIRTGEDGGQYGVCVFDDGTECDEWALFRGECAPGG
jgi:putative hemolysin